MWRKVHRIAAVLAHSCETWFAYRKNEKLLSEDEPKRFAIYELFYHTSYCKYYQLRIEFTETWINDDFSSFMRFFFVDRQIQLSKFNIFPLKIIIRSDHDDLFGIVWGCRHSKHVICVRRSHNWILSSKPSNAWMPFKNGYWKPHKNFLPFFLFIPRCESNAFSLWWIRVLFVVVVVVFL